jgi:hypothetical protein
VANPLYSPDAHIDADNLVEGSTTVYRSDEREDAHVGTWVINESGPATRCVGPPVGLGVSAVQRERR